MTNLRLWLSGLSGLNPKCSIQVLASRLQLEADSLAFPIGSKAQAQNGQREALAPRLDLENFNGQQNASAPRLELDMLNLTFGLQGLDL